MENIILSGAPIYRVMKGDPEYVEGKEQSKVFCYNPGCSTCVIFEDKDYKYAEKYENYQITEEEQKQFDEWIKKLENAEGQDTTDAGTGGMIPGENPPVEDSDERVFVSSSAYDPLAMLFNGFIGVLLLIPKFLLILIGLAIDMIGGLLLSATQEGNVAFSPYTILFNKLDLLSIDFFDLTSTNESLANIRTQIGIWYYNFRNLAIGALLATLVYIGIRMALSTFSEDKAKYKKLLRYWVESFVLLFMLQFIMILIIELNNQVVGLIETVANNPPSATDYLLDAIENNNLLGFAQAICYFMNFGITIAFFIIYLKRLAVVGFLVVIAPLITITYSIDKVKDGKSQALNKWLEQFMYNVLIQIFHCILYMIFITAVFDATIQNNDDPLGFFGSFVTGDMGAQLVTSVISIAMLAFIWKADKIVKGIFGFNRANSTLMDSIVAGKMISSGAKSAKRMAKGTKKSAKVVLKAGDAMTGHKVSNWYNNTPNLKRRLGKVGYGYNKTKGVINRYGGNAAKTLAAGALSLGATGDSATALTTMNGTSQEIKAQENENLKKSLEGQLRYSGKFEGLRNSLTSGSKDKEEVIRKIYDILRTDENSSMSQLSLNAQINNAINTFTLTGQTREEAVENIAKSVL